MAKLSLTNSVKWRALVRRLQIPEPYIRGHLEMFWDCAHYSEKMLFTRDELEIAADWRGQYGDWANAMIELGWVDETETEGVYEIHDYLDHAPKFVKDRITKRLDRKDVPENLRKSENVGECRRMSPNVAQDKGSEVKRSEEKSNTSKPSPPPSAEDDRFSGWYQSYPRKEARRDAEKAWKSLKESERLECLDKTPGWLKLKEGTSKQYIPLPATYLRGRRWKDEIEGGDKPMEIIDPELEAKRKEREERDRKKYNL